MTLGQVVLRGAVMLFVLVVLPITIGVFTPQQPSDVAEVRAEADELETPSGSPDNSAGPSELVSS